MQERVRLMIPWLTFGVASRDPCERHGRWATVTRACLLLHPMPFQTFRSRGVFVRFWAGRRVVGSARAGHFVAAASPHILLGSYVGMASCALAAATRLRIEKKRTRRR